ncbi:tetratricopeptide repeat protein [uncultured Fibrobacter sp.]|uniref:tetratricopeptide repeat protein n=1 Tax=uncultured Fibrobacter sp. TaxID=261512 RepID=UPI0028044A8C|nr:tetratricopeptide repeat protein [uncultured Fibrobacter sp.]
MNNKNRFIVPLVLGVTAVLFLVAVVVSAVVLKTSDRIVGLDYECNYSHNSSFISSIAATLGNRAAEFNKGICLLEKKEYGEAYDALVSAAEKGLAEAQCELGYMYAEGLGVSQDPGKSEHWYRMAANQGERIALASLGSWYYDGIVVPKNRSEAKKLWIRALKIVPENINSNPRVWETWETWRTYVEARLGTMYLDGDGVQQDYDEALRYLTRAASAGDALAQNSLGYMYGMGKGVERDYYKAVKWYKEAAMQGNATAQYNMGFMYEFGQGVEQDYNKAIEWYKKAAAQGYQDAQKNLNRLYENGSASQTASKKSTADDPLGDLDLDNLFTDEDTVGGDPFADLL